MTTATPTPPPDAPATSTGTAADRVLNAVLGGIDLLSIYLGDRLGYYRSLAEHGPATAAQLASFPFATRGSPFSKSRLTRQ